MSVKLTYKELEIIEELMRVAITNTDIAINDRCADICNTYIKISSLVVDLQLKELRD